MDRLRQTLCVDYWMVSWRGLMWMVSFRLNNGESGWHITLAQIASLGYEYSEAFIMRMILVLPEIKLIESTKAMWTLWSMQSLLDQATINQIIHQIIHHLKILQPHQIHKNIPKGCFYFLYVWHQRGHHSHSTQAHHSRQPKLESYAAPLLPLAAGSHRIDIRARYCLRAPLPSVFFPPHHG